MRPTLLFLCALLLAAGAGPGPAFALDPARPLLHYTLDRWTKADGLPNATIRCLAQTADGYVWLGTEEGLVRFDGVRFTIFRPDDTPALPSPLVEHLLATPDGDLWIGTEGGVARRHDGAFSRPAAQGEVGEVFGIVRGPDGTLWVNGAKALFAWDGARLVARPLGGAAGEVAANPSSIGFAHDGAAWLIHDGALFRVANGAAVPWNEPQFAGRHARELYDDARGGLWLQCEPAGTARLEGGRWRFLGARDGLAGDLLRAVLTTSTGDTWAGLAGRGVQLVRGAAVSVLGAAQGLGDDTVESFLEDAHGDLWIGTNGGGLVRLRDAPFVSLGSREGLPYPHTTTVTEDAAGRILVGTQGGGLWRANGTGWARVPAGPHDPGPPVVSALARDAAGRVLIGTVGAGLFRLEGDAWMTLPKGAPPASATIAILAEPDGTLVAGGSFGVARTGRDEGAIDPLPGARLMVSAVRRDAAGALWIGSMNHGLFRGAGGTWEHLFDKPSVLALHADAQGRVWIGTYGGGLALWHDGRLTTFRAKDGLPSDTAFSILEDDDGFLWVGDNGGAYRVAKAALERFARGTIARIPARRFGRLEGLRAAETNGGGEGTGYRAHDGRLWFATPDGVAVVDPRRLRAPVAAPRVAIEEVLVDGQPSASGRDGTHDIPAGGHRVEIRYTVPDPAAAARATFRARFTGLEHEWVEVGSRRTAYATAPAPGRYTFEVLALDAEGAAGSTPMSASTPRPAIVRLRVLPAWWQTTWFRATALLVLVLAAFAAYRVRVSRYAARQAALERLVAARTQELAETNASLERRVADGVQKLRGAERMAAYGELVAGVAHEVRHPIAALQSAAYLLQDMVVDPPPEMRTPLATLQREARRMTVLMDDLLAFARPEAIVRRETEVRPMLAAAADSFAAHDAAPALPVTLDVDPALGRVAVDRDRLEQVLVNLLENARRHARGVTALTLRARGADGRLVLEVADDGAGIDPAVLPRVFEPFFSGGKGTGLGLAIAQRVVQQHGGTIAADSAPGRGTTIRIDLPLNPGPPAVP